MRTCFGGVCEGTLPRFHTHTSYAYEIATLFFFSSFLYRRINSAPFSTRGENARHPKKWPGHEMRLAPHFSPKTPLKKAVFVPLFLRHLTALRKVAYKLVHKPKTLKVGNLGSDQVCLPNDDIVASCLHCNHRFFALLAVSG